MIAYPLSTSGFVAPTIIPIISTFWPRLLTDLILLCSQITAWGSKQCCVGNISSSLMSNYSKTDQLRLGLTISKHICSMSALRSCGQDILIFTKYNIQWQRGEHYPSDSQSSLKSLDNWQALAKLKQALFLAFALYMSFWYLVLNLRNLNLRSKHMILRAMRIKTQLVF